MTPRQLMVVAAAREIRDGELVFVGMRLPLLGFALAKATHAPNAIGLFENGVIRDRPPDGFIYTMGDPPNIVNAVACLGLLDVMSLLQQGRVDAGFIGGAEIDPHGDLNTTRTAASGKMVRLPRPTIDYVTSPGHFAGRRRGGPATLITTFGVFDVTPDGLRVRTRHPGVSVDAIRAATGFPITVPSTVPETAPPTEAELGHIRRADPNGFWTGES